MFKSSKAHSVLSPSLDFTNSLRERSFYKFGQLRAFGIGGEVKATAVDPVVGLLAVGTSTGQIHISGQPAFQCTLSLAGPGALAGLSVKFLTFWVGMGKILCIDSKDQLHMWDLNTIDDRTNAPHKDVTYSLFGNVTYIETPTVTHSHLFYTLKDGITLAYDLLRLNLSPYKIPNVWHAHEERMRRSGIQGHRKSIGPPMATCLAVNPRDLNVMLIGYEGGVIAWDLQKEVAAKTFEMVLPPGSPGGGSYSDPDGLLFTERAPGVTCICWRPDGLVFAVGHEDGCISFWAYDEPDKPLLVRTLEVEDVNVTDAESLFDAGALDNQLRKKDAEGNLVHQSREPIFKLAWASFPDPPSLKALIAAQGSESAGEPLSNATVEYAERGETLLLLLGGQFPRDKTAINVLQFPPYTEPPPHKVSSPAAPSESLPLQQRYAFRDSLAPTGSSSYPTKTPAEDFILLPRSSPYFSLCHDPVAIIVTLGADHSQPQLPNAAARGIEAWAFPPPRSAVVPPSPGRKSFLRPGEDDIVAMTPAPQLAGGNITPRSASQSSWRIPWGPSPESSQLHIPITSLTPKKPKRRLRVPSAYWTGGLTVIGCELISLTTPAFKRLISWSIEKGDDEDEPRIPLHGGLAVPDLQSHGAPDLKVAKMEAYRVLITFHTDATVRFWDISPQLLLLPSPLRFEYPNPLPHLTISIGDYVSHPSVAHLPLVRLWREDRPQVKIASVHLAVEALECIVTMMSGETIVTKFAESQKDAVDVETLRLESDQGISYFPNGPGDAVVEEVTDLTDLADHKEDGFKPVAILTTRRGGVIACAVSDIGFLAVAYANNSMAIIDLRGPEVLLREGFNEDGDNVKKKRKKETQNIVGEQSSIGILKWVISGLGPDSTPLPRLIVSYAKGLTKIYTLTQVLGEWIVDPKPLTITHESLATPLASFVIDPQNGSERLPSRDALRTVMRGGSYERDKDVPHCLWIACSKRSIRCQVNYNGERVAKVEMNGEEFASVHLVTRHGNKVIAGITTLGSVLFYSLPALEFITRFDLFFNAGVTRPIGRISLDDKSGDFMEILNPLDITLRTLFHFRKPLAPRIEPCPALLKRAISPPPVPVSATAGYGSWIWGGAPLTGTQLDVLLAGPNRPGPPKAPPKPSKPLITWGNAPEEPEKPAATSSAARSKAVAKKPAPVVDKRERQDVYTEMRNAAALRGDYLDDLSAKMKGVEESAGSMVSAAKTLYMKEAAKGMAKGFFGKLM